MFRRLALGGVLALLAAGGLHLGCGRGAPPAPENRVIVLGFDGMDYEMVQTLMADGRLPNFSRLSKVGSLTPLQTSVPPQSPVAWSEFITGLDAGGHGIFDFIHRDPETMIPYLSTSKVTAGESHPFGKWQIPGSGDIQLLRHGTPFWEVLEDHGVPTTIIRMPANFPPSGSASLELSGMGTPDILGTPGTFSFYTSELFAFEGEDISGGEIYPVEMWENEVEGTLYGPDNPFLVEKTKLSTEFKAYIDPIEPVIKLEVGDEERVLAVGEWSDWVPIQFDLVPTQTLTAMARFYLKRLEPEFELYVTPLNIDPQDPAMPISTPETYAADLAAATGRFYTQGMPEDTKTLSGGVFSIKEFLHQARLAGEEFKEQYKYVLSRFESGFLFYYFGNLDQISHMMWRTMDPDHPGYKEKRDQRHAGVIPKIYEEFDAIVGYTMERLGQDDTLIVMSDHGFTSWRRSFHLNAWLHQNGYLAVKNRDLSNDPGFFSNVDWSRTRAYGLGLNGLYINIRGRDRNGIVDPADRNELMDEIGEKLLATLDPESAAPAVTKAYQRDKIYTDRGYLDLGPDMLVGYAKRTRGSSESGIGEVGPEVFSDNTDEWSGDHCMDHEAVPGILLTSRPLRKPATRLKNLAASVLAEFGIENFPPREG